MAYGTIVRSGLVTVRRGSVVVTGSGTTWASGPMALQAGDDFRLAGLSELLAQVVSDTEFHLELPWAGEDADDVAYLVRLSAPARSTTAAMAASLAEANTSLQYISQYTLNLPCVAFDVNAPPDFPAPKDTYLIGDAPTGAWASRQGELAMWTGSTWFIRPGQPCDSIISAATGDIRVMNEDGQWAPIGLSLDTGPDRVAVEGMRAEVLSNLTATRAARDEALVALANPILTYVTQAQLFANLSPDAGRLGQVLNDGIATGLYLKSGGPETGAWTWISAVTLPGLAQRVAALEALSFVDDEVSEDALAWVARAIATGEQLFGLDKDGCLVAVPSASLIEAIISAVHQRMRLMVEQDERPVTPLFWDETTGETYFGLDENGGIWGDPSDALRTDLQKSPLASIQVTDRLPTPADGADAGYEVGNEWVLPGKCYVCTQAAPTAIWSGARASAQPGGNGYRDGRLPLPADAIPGTRPILAVSTKLPGIVSAKPCMRLGRDSDSATLELGYVGEDIDYRAMKAFSAGTRARAEIVYNHGSGDDLTWIGSQRPVVSVERNVGGGYSIIFEDGLPSGGTIKPNQGLQIPASITMASNNCAALWLGSHRHSLRDINILELSGDTPLAFGVRDAATIGYALKFGSWKLTGWKPHIGAMCTGFSSSPSGFTFHLSDRYKLTIGALLPSTLAGGMLGLTSQFLNGASEPLNGGAMMSTLLLYDRALSDDEIALVRRCVAAQYDIRPQIRGTLVVIGDSLEESHGAPDYESISRRMSRLLRRPVNTYLFARGGGTFLTEMANFAKGADVFGYPSTVRLAIIALGTNDTNAGATVADLTSRLLAAVAQVRAAGAEIVIVKGIRPRKAFEGKAKETVRVAWNALLRSSFKDTFDADGFIDPDKFPLIGLPGAGSNTAYYSDGTHETALAQGIEADPCADVVDAVLIEKGYI